MEDHKGDYSKRSPCKRVGTITDLVNKQKFDTLYVYDLNKSRYFYAELSYITKQTYSKYNSRIFIRGIFKPHIIYIFNSPH
jgi:hypothetical protein